MGYYRLYVAAQRVEIGNSIDMGVDANYPATWTDISGQVDASAVPLAFFEGIVTEEQFDAIVGDFRYFTLSFVACYENGDPILDAEGNSVSDYEEQIPNELIDFAIQWLVFMGVDVEVYDITSVVQAGKTRAECADALVNLFKTPIEEA